ncbi:HEAT repeat-containing protein 4 isoform X2 [Rhinoderma darwinii]|uniref:HEAT repeat-containing protein 4 isoform X2 n=1 Tax=Rhinoderma darwinii TaxID=43563 RepID=UPI003F67843B
MERPTLYCEQNIFCFEPSQKIGNIKIPINGLPSQKSFSSHVTEFHPPNHHSLKCQEKYIQNVAGDLHFSKEVVKDRGLASLSYQEWDSQDVYNASDLIPQKEIRTISKIQPKQHKLEPKHHHVKKSVPPKKLKAKSCIGFGNSPWKKPNEDERRHVGGSSHLTLENLKPKTFLTEEPTLLTSKESLSSVSRSMSDNSTEVLLKRLTKATAQWIVGHHFQSKKERFFKHYGLRSSMELIHDEQMTEDDFKTCKELENYKPEDQKDITEEHKPETLLPVFYKIPGYISPKKKVQDVGGKNKTEEYLAVKHFELPPPLRLQDRMNPKAGKYVYATDNDFERELYSGASKIIYQKDTKHKNRIVMESNSRYEKHVQPKSYQEWISSDGQTDIDRPLRREKGAHRWVALPTVFVEKTDRSCEKETSTNVLSDRDKEPREIKPGPLNKRQLLQNIVTQWRSAWLLSASWKDATLEQLTRDLGNVHSSHKVSALITIASSAVSAPQQIALPAEILNLVSKTLREEDNLVRMAAALCQYLIREVSEEARKIMFKSLESGTDADSWAAAQCLALEGNHGYLVIKRILEQMFTATNKEAEEQALYMLRELSEHTNLIHVMLAESLNSGNWRERVMSCKALSLLHGNISQVVKNKLSHLMWNDWSPAVRGAAAKALGTLDQGKEVHDQIRKHLESDSWKAKIGALTLIGFLQIMTAQLLPGFLQCFENDFLAVRRQACRTAGLLQLKDGMVMNCLYQLAQNDPVWKIKAHAIKEC